MRYEGVVFFLMFILLKYFFVDGWNYFINGVNKFVVIYYVIYMKFSYLFN